MIVARVHGGPGALLPVDWDWSGAKAQPSLAAGTPTHLSPAQRGGGGGAAAATAAGVNGSAGAWLAQRACERAMYTMAK